jgi:hypothetical protein
MSMQKLASAIVLTGALAVSCTHHPPPPDRNVTRETALERARTELSYTCSEVSDVVGPSQEDETFRYVVTASCNTPEDPSGEHDVRFALRYRYSPGHGWDVVEFTRVDAP